jgi:hypothetical protein
MPGINQRFSSYTLRCALEPRWQCEVPGELRGSQVWLGALGHTAAPVHRDRSLADQGGKTR